MSILYEYFGSESIPTFPSYARSMSSSSDSETPPNLEPENEGALRYHRAMKRLQREFPDIYEDDNPFEVWDWSVRKRRRIIRKAREKIESEKLCCAMVCTMKGMSTFSEMPVVWQLVQRSWMVDFAVDAPQVLQY